MQEYVWRVQGTVGRPGWLEQEGLGSVGVVVEDELRGGSS